MPWPNTSKPWFLRRTKNLGKRSHDLGWVIRAPHIPLPKAWGKLNWHLGVFIAGSSSSTLDYRPPRHAIKLHSMRICVRSMFHPFIHCVREPLAWLNYAWYKTGLKPSIYFHLQHAKDLMSAAETRGGQAFIFQKWSSRIQRALDEANKDNDLIYHARVPDLSTLPALGKHAVAKATDFAEPLSSNFQGETNLRAGSRFAPIQWEMALLCKIRISPGSPASHLQESL